jgi:hypothetical protein
VRNNPVAFKSLVDNRDFDFFDCYRWLIDAENARALARSWAKAAGKFREVVGCVKTLNRILTFSAPGEVVPLWDQIAQRATVMAEGNAAVHAASGLASDYRWVALFIDFFPVHDANRNGSALGSLSLSRF